jgi:membrane-associated phospholipid phosphatase
MHTKWLDQVFIKFTFLGDGLFSIIIAAFLFLVRKLRRLSLYIIITYLVSGIAALVLKRIFMAPRPREIINSHLYTSFLNGITGSGWDSFPSGHTTSVFALATVLALNINKKSWGLLFLIMAIITGYSRIYLGQHFLQDVLAGAVLGTGIGVLIYTFVNFPPGQFKSEDSSGTIQDNSPYSSGLAGN